VKDLAAVFRELMQDVELGASDIQLIHFVVRKTGVTTWGQYRQALLELRARRQNLLRLYAERSALRLAVRSLRRRLLLPWGREKRRTDLRLRELDAEDIELKISAVEREFRTLMELALHLRDELGEMTPGRRHELELEYWKKRFDASAYAGERSVALFENQNALLEDGEHALYAQVPDLEVPDFNVMAALE
jgi:hypothetical protein